MKVYFDSGAKSSGGREDSESSGPQRRNSSEANSGDFLDLKVSAAIQGTRAVRFMPFRNEISHHPPPFLCCTKTCHWSFGVCFLFLP